MARLGLKLRSLQGNLVTFRCPGCQSNHSVRVASFEGGPNTGGCWGYNGNADAPTFTPSILLRSGHYINNTSPGNCWCDFEQRFGRQVDFKCMVCHSFITDGRIQFLSDCTHHLAGQTVDLPDIGEE